MPESNKPKRVVIKSDLEKRWRDIDVHKIAFGHLPDASCNSDHPLECNRPKENPMPESESKIPKELLEKAGHLGARRQRVNEIVADLYIGAREGGKAKDLLEPATEATLKEIDEALASEREKIRKWAEKEDSDRLLIHRSSLIFYLDSLDKGE